MGSVIAGGVIVALLGLAVRSLWKNRKSGGCGCGCEACPNHGVCHPNEQ